VRGNFNQVLLEKIEQNESDNDVRKNRFIEKKEEFSTYIEKKTNSQRFSLSVDIVKEVRELSFNPNTAAKELLADMYNDNEKLRDLQEKLLKEKVVTPRNIIRKIPKKIILAQNDQNRVQNVKNPTNLNNNMNNFSNSSANNQILGNCNSNMVGNQMFRPFFQNQSQMNNLYNRRFIQPFSKKF